MADISKIMLPNGIEYDIKDATARQASDGLNARLIGDIEILSGADLDDYTTLGEYYCWGNGANVSNKPPISISSFRLRVEVWGRYSYSGGAYHHDLLKQTLYPVYDLDTDEYYVRKEGVTPTNPPRFTWNGWIKYSNSDENYTTAEKTKLASIAIETNIVITLASTDWSATTTSIDNVPYYTATATVSNLVKEYPTIYCGSSSTLPSSQEKNAFNLINYAVADLENHTITFYAMIKPTINLTINIIG